MDRLYSLLHIEALILISEHFTKQQSLLNTVCVVVVPIKVKGQWEHVTQVLLFVCMLVFDWSTEHLLMSGKLQNV